MPASTIYDSFVDDLVNGQIVPSADTYFVMLVNGYSPSKTGDTRRSNVTSESSGSGYTTGGAASAVTIAKNTGTNQETLTFAQVVWTITTSLTATGCVIYKSRGGAASNDNLVAYVDFGGTFTSSNSTFTAQFSTPLTFQS
jgi:hypothetical protein